LPRIGLLSDSHGQAATTRRAVHVLLEQRAELLVHLGDVGTVEVIDALLATGPDGKAVESHLVFGNTDWDAAALGRYAAEVGIIVDHPTGRLSLGGSGGGGGGGDEGGSELVFCHGHEPAVTRAALAEGVAYLCHGHTHVASDEREGQTRVINPGALFRARRYTVALLETESDTLTFYPVSAG